MNKLRLINIADNYDSNAEYNSANDYPEEPDNSDEDEDEDDDRFIENEENDADDEIKPNFFPSQEVWGKQIKKK